MSSCLSYPLGVASAVEDPRKKTSKRRGRNSEGQVKKPRKSSSIAEATLTASAATEEPKPPHYPSAEKSRGSYLSSIMVLAIISYLNDCPPLNCAHERAFASVRRFYVPTCV